MFINLYISCQKSGALHLAEPGLMRLADKIRAKLAPIPTSNCNHNLIQKKHPECKKRSSQKFEKGRDEKELKSKWVAKAGVV